MRRPQKDSYIGIDLVEVDADSLKDSASLHRRPSKFSLLKSSHAQRRTRNALSLLSNRVQYALSKDCWHQVIPTARSFIADAFVDLKRIRPHRNSRDRAWRCFTLVWPLVFIGAILIALPKITSRKLYSVNAACRPDSGFYVGFDEYDIWDPSGFFQITLGFGDFSFTAAKSIDVGWDVIVGRGGQCLLAAIAFVVYSKALVRSMESSPVTYGTFEAVTLQTGSFVGTLKLARDLFKNKTTQARATVLWMILSATFVLAFPTILSAMSGYSVNIGSFVELDNGNLVVYSNFSVVRYTIHDAYRIDEAMGKDYLVTTGGNAFGNREISQLEDETYSDLCASVLWVHDDLEGNLDWSLPAGDPMCLLYWHVSQYAFKYGFLGLGEAESIFNHSGKLIDLAAPSLNISAIFWRQDWLESERSNGTDWSLWPYGYDWADKYGNRPFHEFVDPIFTNGASTYNLAELNERGRCQQDGESYRWGFSFLILFCFFVAFLVWCVGMYVMWLDAFLFSRFDRVGRSMGLQRAVLDLAYCMDRDMDETGRDMLSNHELQSTIRRDLKGGRITYEMLDPKYLPLSRAAEWQLYGRHATTRWLRKNVWMFTFFVLSLGFLAAALAGTHTPLFTAILLTVGSGTVLSMGDEHVGRWLIFFVCVVLAIALAPVGPYVYLDKDHYSIIWLRANAYYELDWWYNY